MPSIADKAKRAAELLHTAQIEDKLHDAWMEISRMYADKILYVTIESSINSTPKVRLWVRADQTAALPKAVKFFPHYIEEVHANGRGRIVKNALSDARGLLQKTTCPIPTSPAKDRPTAWVRLLTSTDEG